MGRSIFNALYFVLELTNYTCLYEIMFGIRVRKIKGLHIGVILVSFLFVFLFFFTGLDGIFGDYTDSNIVSVFIILLGTILVPTFFLEERKGRWYLAFFSVIIFYYSLANFFERMVYVAIDEEVKRVVEIYLIEDLVMLPIELSLIYHGRKTHKKSVSFSLLYIVTLFVLSVACIFITSGVELLLELLEENKLFVNIVLMSSYLFTVLFFVAIASLAEKSNRNMYLVEQQALADMMLVKQETQVKGIIERDTELRRFRHDLKGHMQAIRSFAVENDIDGLLNYVDEIDHELSKNKASYYTGVVAVDAIIEYLNEQMREKKIELEWSGSAKGLEKVPVYDLGIIFQNLLKNAMEAVDKLEQDRKIFASVFEYNSKIGIKITNRYTGSVNLSSTGDIKTSKPDKDNHGLGLTNVKLAVEKNNGTIDIKAENGFFEAFVLV